MAKNFQELLSKLSSCGRKTLSVACAQDTAVLEAVKEAHDLGIIDAVLVGDEAKIREIANEIKMDCSQFTIINEPDSDKAPLTAVQLVHDGKADMYMKGILPTKNFLKSVLNKEVGLRTGKPLSHVCVFEVPGIDRLLFLSDVAFIPYPTLEDKKHIIEYDVDVANACGVENPKVAPLAAVEVVNPKMPCTVDADELRKAQGRHSAVPGYSCRQPRIQDHGTHGAGSQERQCAGWHSCPGHSDITFRFQGNQGIFHCPGRPAGRTYEKGKRITYGI